MTNGTVLGIFIAEKAGDPMQSVQKVLAEQGAGLVGDRYLDGNGSWNKGRRGQRQVTLINGQFFPESGFQYAESRRNIVTDGIELMNLIGKEFSVGEATLRGVKYCDPCQRPSKLAGKEHSFHATFFDRGGLIAEVLVGGTICVNDAIVPFKKNG